MQTHFRSLMLCLLPAAALGQQNTAPAPAAPPARTVTSPEQLEPGVNTSAPAAAPDGALSQNTDSLKGAPQPAGPTSAATGKADAQAAAAHKDAPAKGTPKKAGPDRLQLDATDITGSRELPKVLYIVPWKRSDLGDLTGKPPNSLLDEVLQPVDRDVFKRENRYYDALKPDPQSAPAGDAAGAQKNP